MMFIFQVAGQAEAPANAFQNVPVVHDDIQRNFKAQPLNAQQQKEALQNVANQVGSQLSAKMANDANCQKLFNADGTLKQGVDFSKDEYKNALKDLLAAAKAAEVPLKNIDAIGISSSDKGVTPKADEAWYQQQNQALANDRAAKLKDFLVATLGLETNQVTATGIVSDEKRGFGVQVEIGAPQQAQQPAQPTEVTPVSENAPAMLAEERAPATRNYEQERQALSKMIKDYAYIAKDPTISNADKANKRLEISQKMQGMEYETVLNAINDATASGVEGKYTDALYFAMHAIWARKATEAGNQESYGFHVNEMNSLAKNLNFTENTELLKMVEAVAKGEQFTPDANALIYKGAEGAQLETRNKIAGLVQFTDYAVNMGDQGVVALEPKAEAGATQTAPAPSEAAPVAETKLPGAVPSGESVEVRTGAASIEDAVVSVPPTVGNHDVVTETSGNAMKIKVDEGGAGKEISVSVGDTQSVTVDYAPNPLGATITVSVYNAGETNPVSAQSIAIVGEVVTARTVTSGG